MRKTPSVYTGHLRRSAIFLGAMLLCGTIAPISGCATTKSKVPGDGLEASSKLQRQDPLSTWQRQDSTLKFIE